MARPMRECLTAWLQQEGIEEPETNPNVPWQEQQSHAIEGKVKADYDPDVDCEPD